MTNELSQPKEIKAEFGGDFRRIDFLGFGRCKSSCYVETVKTSAGALVLFTEDPKNEGTSVINAIESLITIVVTAQLLDPVDTVVIERHVDDEDTWGQILFKWIDQEACDIHFLCITREKTGKLCDLLRLMDKS